MLKWISLAIVLTAVALYFSGALELDNSGDSVNITVDKDKAQDLGESIKEKFDE